MTDLTRLSFSIENTLFNKLEKLVKDKGYNNRSEFIRDMIRDQLVTQEWNNNQQEVVGTITLIYDHHKRELSNKLTEVQHSHHEVVLTSTHVHLTKEICAEMIMVKGSPKQVKTLSDTLKQQRGVLHSGLIMGSTGYKLK
jgi:CopG family transcriptional regulator, nickel-responsive regulator